MTSPLADGTIGDDGEGDSDRQHTEPHWSLTLYVNGASPRSTAAIDNIRRVCDTELQGVVDLEIIDVRDEPALVIKDAVVVVPTLVKRWPRPLRRLVGDLSDSARLHVGLDLAPSGLESGPHER